MLDRSLELRAGLWAEPPWYPKPVKLLLIQLQVASSLAVGVDALVVAARAALAGATLSRCARCSVMAGVPVYTQVCTPLLLCETCVLHQCLDLLALLSTHRTYYFTGLGTLRYCACGSQFALQS